MSFSDPTAEAVIRARVEDTGVEAKLAELEAKLDATTRALGRKEAVIKIKTETGDLKSGVADARARLAELGQEEKRLAADRAKLSNQQLSANTRRLQALEKERTQLQELIRTNGAQIRQKGDELRAVQALAAQESNIESARRANAAAEQARARLRADADKAALSAAKDIGRARLDEAKATERAIKLEQDLLDARRRMEQLARNESRTFGTGPRQELRVESARAKADFIKAREEMVALGRDPVHIRTDVDPSGLEKLRNFALFWNTEGQKATEDVKSLGERLRDFGASGSKINLGPLNVSLRTMLGIATLGAPVIAALGGALGSLVAVVGSGLVGAVGLGGAALSGFGLTALGVGSAIKGSLTQLSAFKQALNAYQVAQLRYGPATQTPTGRTSPQTISIDRQKETLAQDKLNAAVAKYGPNSLQARTATLALESAQNRLSKAQTQGTTTSNRTQKALDRLNQVIGQSSPEMRNAERGWLRLSDTWSKLTGTVARHSLGQVLSETFKTANANVGWFARETNRAMTNLASGITSWMHGLRTPEAKRILSDIMGNFVTSIPAVTEALGHLGAALGRWFDTMSRYLPGIAGTFDKWARGVDDASKRTDGWRKGSETLITSLKDIGHFAESAAKFLVALFSPGVRPGQSFVEDMTHALDRATASMKTLSGQQGLTDFFSKGVKGTEELFHALTPLAQLFISLANIFAPIAILAAQIVTWFGKLTAGFITALGPLGNLLRDVVALAVAMRLLGKLSTFGRGAFSAAQEGASVLLAKVKQIAAAMTALFAGQGWAGIKQGWQQFAPKSDSAKFAAQIEEGSKAGATMMQSAIETAGRVVSGMFRESITGAGGVSAAEQEKGIEAGGAISAGEQEKGVAAGGAAAASDIKAAEVTGAAGGAGAGAGAAAGAGGVAGAAGRFGASALGAAVVGYGAYKLFSSSGESSDATYGTGLASYLGPSSFMYGRGSGLPSDHIRDNPPGFHGSSNLGDILGEAFSSGKTKEVANMSDDVKHLNEELKGLKSFAGLSAQQVDQLGAELQKVGNEKDTTANQRKGIDQLLQMLYGPRLKAATDGFYRQLSGEKYAPTIREMSGAILRQFDKLPPAMQRSGAAAIVAHVAGMERNGKLPIGYTDRLIHRLELMYGPEFASKLAARGETSMAAITNAIQRSRVVSATQHQIDEISKHWTGLIPDVRVTGNNIQQVLSSAIETLRQKIKTTNGKQRAELVAHLNSLLQLQLQYAPLIRDAGLIAFKDIAGSIGGYLSAIFGSVSGFVGNVVSAFGSIGGPLSADVSAWGGYLSSLIGPLNNLQGKIGQVQGALTGLGPAGVGGLFHHAQGGFVRGDSSRDSTLIAASGGEFVVTRHGQAMMESEAPGLLGYINQNQMPHFASGGTVPGPNDARLPYEHRLQHEFANTTAFLRKEWALAAPLYNQTGRAMPHVTYTQGKDALFVGTDAQGRPGHRQVFVPDWIVTGKGNGGVGLQGHDSYFVQLMLHEWAHEFQRNDLISRIKAPKGIDVWEGLAQAFSILAAPAVFEKLNIRGPLDLESYAYDTAWVQGNLSNDWPTNRQFGFTPKPLASGAKPKYPVPNPGLMPTVDYDSAHWLVRIFSDALANRKDPNYGIDANSWLGKIEQALHKTSDRSYRALLDRLNRETPKTHDPIYRSLASALGALHRKLLAKEKNIVGYDTGGAVAANGGVAVPGSGSGDKVLMQAMVEPGETVFVLNRNASAATSNLAMANSAIPRLAAGGSIGVGRLPPYRGPGKPTGKDIAGEQHFYDTNLDAKLKEYNRLVTDLKTKYHYNEGGHLVGKEGHFVGRKGSAERAWVPGNLMYVPGTPTGDAPQAEIAKLNRARALLTMAIQNDPHKDQKHPFSAVWDLPPSTRIGGVGTQDIDDALQAASTMLQDTRNSVGTLNDQINRTPKKDTGKKAFQDLLRQRRGLQAKQKQLEAEQGGLFDLKHSANAYITEFGNIESTIAILGGYMDMAAASPDDMATGKDPGRGASPKPSGPDVRKKWSEWKALRQYWEQQHVGLLQEAIASAENAFNRKHGKLDRYGIQYLQTLLGSEATAETDEAALAATQDPAAQAVADMTLDTFIDLGGHRDELNRLNYQYSIDQGTVVPDEPGTQKREDIESMGPEIADAMALRDFYRSRLTEAQTNPLVGLGAPHPNYPLLTSASEAYNQAKSTYDQLQKQVTDVSSTVGPDQIQMADTARANMFQQYGGNVAPVMAAMAGGMAGPMVGPGAGSGATAARILAAHNPATMGPGAAPTYTQPTSGSPTINNYYKTQPADPHTWSSALAWELQGLV